jgi:hypothetical protein
VVVGTQQVESARRLAVVAVALAVCLVAGTARAATPDPGVLVIGDSVSTGMYWYASATVERHLDVNWQIAVCRRVGGQSCYDQGVSPPTMLDLIASLGTVPPTIVVEMGYNDLPDSFAANVDAAMRALIGAGAQHVLWLTLREVQDPYPQLNGVLHAAAARYPQLSLLDWNAWSGNHPEWFQGDGIHLDRTGGIAMAHFVHAALDARLNPLHIATQTLPAAHPGRDYSVRLHATGGNAAYFWSLASGTLPPGLHLLRTGRLYGRPLRGTSFTLRVRVTDEDGLSAVSAVRGRPDPS